MVLVLKVYTGWAITLVGVLHKNNILFISGGFIISSGVVLAVNIAEEFNKSVLSAVLAIEDDSFHIEDSDDNDSERDIKGSKTLTSIANYLINYKPINYRNRSFKNKNNSYRGFSFRNGKSKEYRYCPRIWVRRRTSSGHTL